MSTWPVPATTVVSAAVGAVFLLSPLACQTDAAAFSYISGDLIAAFRAEGGASDLVTRLGAVSDFEGLTVGTTVAMSTVTSAQLTAAFPSLAGVAWSVLGVQRGNTNFAQYPLHTLWVSSPSLGSNVPGPVWRRQGVFTQGPIGGQIEAIGLGAAVYASQRPAGPNNSAEGVVLDAADASAYSTLMTSAGNLADTFPGVVESTTPAAFGPGAEPSRALLYQLQPASGEVLNTPGRLLGYFDFWPAGALTFTAGPPPGTILALHTDTTGARVDFATLPSFSYRLRFTGESGLGRPLTEWTPGEDVVAGDGSVASLPAPGAVGARFFIVEAF